MNVRHIKDLFLSYEKIRASGKYNMITDAKEVMSKMGLNSNSDSTKYFDIIQNYSHYQKMFG